MDKESEQIKQLYDLEENQTGLQTLATDPYRNFMRTSSQEAIDHLNI